MPNRERRWFEPDRMAAELGEAMPLRLLRRYLAESLRGLDVALCLHRATESGSPQWPVGLNTPPGELDALLELLASARTGADQRITITFDDGYADAAEYVRSRAPQYPHFEFLFFVCPEKVEKRVGFRWDLVAAQVRAGASSAAASELIDAPFDVEGENRRQDLGALADLPEFRLVSVEETKALMSLSNVALGNHTNLHASASRLAPDHTLLDYQRSSADFERLFGPQTHFAFPFGTPRAHFHARHVAQLRTLTPALLWTTEARPSRPSERRPSGVLPRYPIDGRRSARALAGWIAARALAFRVRGPKEVY